MDEYLVHSEDGSVRPQSRGGKGRRDIRTTQRNGPVVSIRCLEFGGSVILVSSGGMLVRIPGDSISQIGRNTMGVRLVNLKAGDCVVATAKAEEVEDVDLADQSAMTTGEPEHA